MAEDSRFSSWQQEFDSPRGRHISRQAIACFFIFKLSVSNLPLREIQWFFRICKHNIPIVSAYKLQQTSIDSAHYTPIRPEHRPYVPPQTEHKHRLKMPPQIHKKPPVMWFFVYFHAIVIYCAISRNCFVLSLPIRSTTETAISTSECLSSSSPVESKTLLLRSSLSKMS